MNSIKNKIKYLDSVYGKRHRAVIKTTMRELGKGAGYALRS
jgi:hypothetical protein